MNGLVTTSLRPLSRQPMDDLRRPLAILFSSYPVFNSTPEDAAARTAAYLLAISDLPEWCIMSAVTRFIQGKVERKNRDRMPTAEQVASEARSIVDDEREKARMRRIADQYLRERREEQEALATRLTPEERAAQVTRLLGRSIKTMPQE